MYSARLSTVIHVTLAFNYGKMPLLLQLNRTNNHFSFSKEDKVVADFKLNIQSSSFRLNATTKRLFFIESSGLLQNKTVLKTEYGVEIGEWIALRSIKSGFVTLNAKKLNYRITGQEFRITDKSKQTVAVCDFSYLKEFEKPELAAILFSIAWLVNETPKEKPVSKKTTAK
jgi:hypothetical protein